MGLFKCDKCGVMDNTALAKDYWLARIEKRPLHCSQCGKPGIWHEHFPRLTPEEHGLAKGSDGYWYRPEQISVGGSEYPRVWLDGTPPPDISVTNNGEVKKDSKAKKWKFKGRQ